MVTEERRAEILKELDTLLTQMKSNTQTAGTLLQELDPVIALDAKMTWLPRLEQSICDIREYLLRPPNFERTIKLIHLLDSMPEVRPEQKRDMIIDNH